MANINRAGDADPSGAAKLALLALEVAADEMDADDSVVRIPAAYLLLPDPEVRRAKEIEQALARLTPPTLCMSRITLGAVAIACWPANTVAHREVLAENRTLRERLTQQFGGIEATVSVGAKGRENAVHSLASVLDWLEQYLILNLDFGMGEVEAIARSDGTRMTMTLYRQRPDYRLTFARRPAD